MHTSEFFKDDIRLKITRIYGADVIACPDPIEHIPRNEWEKLSEEEKNLSGVIAGKKWAEELEKNDPNVVW